MKKRYLTRKEACEVLYQIREKEEPVTKEVLRSLEMIRICLVAEDAGLHLWGKGIEETRPVFFQSIPETQKCYEEDLKKAIAIAME